jgi:hypothetical protein
MSWPLSPCNKVFKNLKVLRIAWICSYCKCKWNQNGWMEYKITYNFWKVVWNIRVCAKWKYFFKKTQLISESSFAIPGTSAATERIFFITNALWTDEKHSFLVENIKAVSKKTNFEEFSCNDFCTLISNSRKLLQEIRSSTKYKTFAQKRRNTPSTLTGN